MQNAISPRLPRSPECVYSMTNALVKKKKREGEGEDKKAGKKNRGPRSGKFRKSRFNIAYAEAAVRERESARNRWRLNLECR